jgi:signal transduction histidine kinase
MDKKPLRGIRDGFSELADALEKGEDYGPVLKRIKEHADNLSETLRPKTFIEKPDGSRIPLEEAKGVGDKDKVVTVQPDFPLKERMAMHAIKNMVQLGFSASKGDMYASGAIGPGELRDVAQRATALLERLDKPFHAEQVSLKEIIKEHLNTPGVKVSFEPDTTEHVEGDRYLIKGLVDNLFNNSRQNLLENKDKLKKMEISVTLKDLGEYVKLIHEDSGTGFPKGFDPLDPRTTRADKGGTGQGIREIMDVAKAHRMQINFENRLEGGARVTVRIPKKHKTVEEHRKLA